MAFRSPQINTYVDDVEGAVRFYTDVLGFRETFRVPDEWGVPLHVEVTLEGLVLGFATPAAAKEMHGLDVADVQKQFEIVLWTVDVEADYARLIAAGATPLSEPHLFIGRLRGAWLRDPFGINVHIVQEISAPV